jgi:hypothetical protein
MRYPIPALERAEAHWLHCPFTGQDFLVQFWDMHEERRGKRRMAVAIFANSPTFPTHFRLVLRSRDFWPSPLVSCDGPDAARHAVSFLELDDVSSDDLEANDPADFGEHSLG